MVKKPSANAGDIREVGSIPGSGRSLGGGHGNPLQHPCLKYPMDRGAWRATVHRVAKSQTQLKRLNSQHKKRTYLERNAFHRQNAVCLKRQEWPWEKHTPQTDYGPSQKGKRLQNMGWLVFNELGNFIG